MRSRAILLFALLLAGLAGVGIRADDKPAPKAQQKAAPIDEREVKAAEERIRALGADEFAVLSGLRYLLRPSFEDELFTGRRRQHCPIDPIENLSREPLGVAEQLRLWAVLESGMPGNASISAQFERLDLTPPPEIKDQLAPLAVYMLTLRAALGRMTVKDGAKFIERARLALAANKSAASVCSPQSALVGEDGVAVQWFANHFWRAVIFRAALEMGLSADFKPWGRDLNFLVRAHVDGAGWTCHRKQEPSVDEDLHPNLLAIAAIGLAQGAPAGAWDKSASRDLASAQRFVGPIVARLVKQYPEEPLIGGRALLLCAGLAAPEGVADSVGWRNGLVAENREALSAPGRPAIYCGLSPAMGLSNNDGAADPLGEVAEAALALVLACGGLFRPGAGPLAKHEMGELARMLHALAIIEASRAPEIPTATEFDERVKRSVERGRAYLLSVQKRDGTFPGLGKLESRCNPGDVSVALLALMHAGESRDSEPVQRGYTWLQREGMRMKGISGSLQAAQHLMMLQKYFEPELDESGMLDAGTPAQYVAAKRRLKDKLKKEVSDLVQGLSESIVGVRAVDFDDFANENIYSEYAVLGLKAACVLGAEVDSRVFSREVARINKYMLKSKSMEQVLFERPWKKPDDKAATPRSTGTREYVPCRYTSH